MVNLEIIDFEKLIYHIVDFDKQYDDLSDLRGDGFTLMQLLKVLIGEYLDCSMHTEDIVDVLIIIERSPEFKMAYLSLKSKLIL